MVLPLAPSCRNHLIETVTAVVAELGEHGDELALAAAELDHHLAVQVEALHQLFCQTIMEAVEGRRHRLGRFVVLVIPHQPWVEGGVPDKAAAATEAQPDVAPRAVKASARLLTSFT